MKALEVKVLLAFARPLHKILWNGTVEAYIFMVVFNDVQYEERYESCSSGCESKKIVGRPKSRVGRSDIVWISNGRRDRETKYNMYSWCRRRKMILHLHGGCQFQMVKAAQREVQRQSSMTMRGGD